MARPTAHLYFYSVVGGGASMSCPSSIVMKIVGGLAVGSNMGITTQTMKSDTRAVSFLHLANNLLEISCVLVRIFHSASALFPDVGRIPLILPATS